MKARLIYSKIWRDSFFMKLSEPHKLLFMYYLTCEAVTLCHIFEIPAPTVLYETGLYKREDADEVLQNFKQIAEQKGSMYFYDDYVYIANADKYDNFGSWKTQKAVNEEIKQLNKDVKEWYKKVTGTALAEFVIVVPNAKGNKKPKTKDSGTPKQEKAVFVPHKHIDYLRELDKDPEFVAQLMEKHKVTREYVLSVAEDIINYCKKTGRQYKDYKAVLDDWIKRNIEKTKTVRPKQFVNEDVSKYKNI